MLREKSRVNVIHIKIVTFCLIILNWNNGNANNLYRLRTRNYCIKEIKSYFWITEYYCNHNKVGLKMVLILSGGFGISEGTTTGAVADRVEFPNGQR